MNSDKNTSRFLGAAFLLQVIASLVNGLFLLQPLIVPGNITESMVNIANNAFQLRASIVVEMLTVIGIVMIGVLMYDVLKKQDRKIAIVAMGLYLVEATILAVSRIPAYVLLLVSQESVIAGHPDYMQVLANMLYESMNFGYELHMLPFALGATLFYYLFYKSGYLPRWLSLLGIVASPLALVGTFLNLLGYEVPIVVFILNLPFELGIGLWLLIKGIRVSSETK